MSNGKGISDAVREAISDWMIPEITSALKVSRWQVDNPKSWVRRVRRRRDNGIGWERDYACKTNAQIVLRVHTNEADTRINYVTFRVDNSV